jgi:tetratricopeptide (TPR) repeat protein
MLKKIFLILSFFIAGTSIAKTVDEKVRNHLSGAWSVNCGVAGETYIVIEAGDGGSLKLVSKNRDVVLSNAKLIEFVELPASGNKSNYAEGTLLGTYQLDWEREDNKTKKKDNRRWKIDYLKNAKGVEQYAYIEVTIDGKKTVQDNKITDSGKQLTINSKCLSEQTAKMSEGVPQKEVELRDAIQRLSKTPVQLSQFNDTYEAFCRSEDEPKYDSLRRLQDACNVYIANEKSTEAVRAAANLILGIGLSNFTDNQFPGQPCRDSFEFLQKSADYIEKNKIAINDAHERIGYCLLYLDRTDQALNWLDRSNKLKQSAYSTYLMGIAYQNMKNFAQAKNYYQNALALNPTYEAAKQRLAQLDQAVADNDRQQVENKKRAEEVNSPTCNAWRAAITKNRAICDPRMSTSLDAFYMCMDLGMTRSGYAKRADNQTQQLYQQCGVGSWTESQLAPR